MEFEIGIGKSGRRAYGFDDIAIVPSRRTRDPEDVDIRWEIDAYTLRAADDGQRHGRGGLARRPRSRSAALGGLACLNLEGLWTRYEDPEPIFEEIAELPDEKATRRMQELYAEPIKAELIGAAHRGDQGRRRRVAAPRSPRSGSSSTRKLVLEAELDILVIQGTVVSAEHVSQAGRAAQPEEVHPRASTSR